MDSPPAAAPPVKCFGDNWIAASRLSVRLNDASRPEGTIWARFRYEVPCPGRTETAVKMGTGFGAAGAAFRRNAKALVRPYRLRRASARCGEHQGFASGLLVACGPPRPSRCAPSRMVTASARRYPGPGQGRERTGDRRVAGGRGGTAPGASPAAGAGAAGRLRDGPHRARGAAPAAPGRDPRRAHPPAPHRGRRRAGHDGARPGQRRRRRGVAGRGAGRPHRPRARGGLEPADPGDGGGGRRATPTSRSRPATCGTSSPTAPSMPWSAG